LVRCRIPLETLGTKHLDSTTTKAGKGEGEGRQAWGKSADQTVCVFKFALIPGTLGGSSEIKNAWVDETEWQQDKGGNQTIWFYKGKE